MTLTDAAAICHSPYSLQTQARLTLDALSSASRVWADDAYKAYAAGAYQECMRLCEFAEERADDMRLDRED